MKDLLNEKIESKDELTTSEQEENLSDNRTKKGHKKFSKGENLIMKLGFGMMAIFAGLYIWNFIFTVDDSQPSTPAPSSVKVTEVGAVDTPETSKAQKQRLEQAREEGLSDAEKNETSFISDGIFDPNDAEKVAIEERVTKISGVAADPEEIVDDDASINQPTIETQTNFSNQTSQPFNNGNQNNYSTGNSHNGQFAEIKRNRISGLISKFKDGSSQSSSLGPQSETGGNRMLGKKRDSILTTRNPNSEVSGNDYEWGLDNTKSQSSDNNFASGSNQVKKSTGDGRGLWVGDVLLGKVKNGLKSTTPSHLMMVEILQPEELAGAQITFTPSVEYDNYVFSANSFNFKGNNELLNAIVVTPDANLTTGYRSDVNYHEVYKFGMIFLSGVFSGAADYVKQLGGNVSVKGDTVIQSNEFDTRNALIASAGGVATAAQGEVANAINKPPTVWVNAGDIVGIMVVEDYNPTWFPFFPKHRRNILDNRQ